MGLDRGINPPGISATVAQMLAALEAVRPGAGALVRPAPDPDIAAIVGTWPAAFAPMRARALGFATHEPLVEPCAPSSPTTSPPPARSAGWQSRLKELRWNDRCVSVAPSGPLCRLRPGARFGSAGAGPEVPAPSRAASGAGGRPGGI